MDKRLRDILIIIISFAVSWMFALSGDIHDLHMGVAGNFFLPPIAGIATLLIYLMGAFLVKKNALAFLVACCILNLSIGLLFYISGT